MFPVPMFCPQTIPISTFLQLPSLPVLPFSTRRTLVGAPHSSVSQVSRRVAVCTWEMHPYTNRGLKASLELLQPSFLGRVRSNHPSHPTIASGHDSVQLCRGSHPVCRSTCLGWLRPQLSQQRQGLPIQPLYGETRGGACDTGRVVTGGHSCP